MMAERRRKKRKLSSNFS